MLIPRRSHEKWNKTKMYQKLRTDINVHIFVQFMFYYMSPKRPLTPIILEKVVIIVHFATGLALEKN